MYFSEDSMPHRYANAVTQLRMKSQFHLHIFIYIIYCFHCPAICSTVSHPRVDVVRRPCSDSDMLWHLKNCGIVIIIIIIIIRHLVSLPVKKSAVMGCKPCVRFHVQKR